MWLLWRAWERGLLKGRPSGAPATSGLIHEGFSTCNGSGDARVLRNLGRGEDSLRRGVFDGVGPLKEPGI